MKGNTFLVVVNEITFKPVPWNCMTIRKLNCFGKVHISQQWINTICSLAMQVFMCHKKSTHSPCVVSWPAVDHPVLRHRRNDYSSMFLSIQAAAASANYDAIILTCLQERNGKRDHRVQEHILVLSNIHVCQQLKFYCLCSNSYGIIRLSVMCTWSRPKGGSETKLEFLQSVDVTFSLAKLWSVGRFSSFWLWFLGSKCCLCYSQWWQHCSKWHSAWN